MRSNLRRPSLSQMPSRNLLNLSPSSLATSRRMSLSHLKRRSCARSLETPPGNRASKALAETASEDADAGVVVGAVGEDAAGSKLLPRRSVQPLRRELFLTCQRKRSKKDPRNRPKVLSPKFKPRRKRPKLLQLFPPQRHVPPRASWCWRSDCPVPARVPGSNATTLFRSQAIW